MSLPPGGASREATFPSGHGDKRELRRLLIQARLDLDAGTRERWNAAIVDHMLGLLSAWNIRSLGAYWPIRNEPDLGALYGALTQQGVRLALPVVVAPDAPLAFVAWKPGDQMVEEGMGICVPRERQPAALPEALLAPCIGFNAARYRLGYGGGFFDRTLAAARPSPFAIGVAYAFQQADFAPDVFDVPLDCIVTEAGILR